MRISRGWPRWTMFAAAVAAAMAAGCQGVEPPPDLDAPPTEHEKRVLGGDAYDSYFLNAWRKCTRFASDYTCRRKIYGGDEL